MRTQLPSVLLATAIVFSISVLPAQAVQRARVFVASYGSDSNPCTFGSPCKTFAQAITVVAQGGEITAIDSAGFGPVTIEHSITITSPAGVEAGIAAESGGNAITINAGTNDVITVHGLTLEGGGTGGSNGIVLNSGSKLDISDCTVRDYVDSGIAVIATNTAAFLVTISNTEVINNATGLSITANGSATVYASIDNVTATGDSVGVSVSTPSANAFTVTTVANSNISNDTTAVQTAGSTQATNMQVNLVNVTSVGNTNTALVGIHSVLTLSHVNDSQSVNGIVISGGFVDSDNTNHITAVTGGSPAAYPFQ